MKYLLFDVYNVTISSSNIRKPDCVACLMAEMEKDASKYEIILPRISQDVENSNTAKIPV